MDMQSVKRHGIDILKIGSYSAAMMTIVGGLMFMGFGFKFPWYARAEGEKLQTTVDSMVRTQNMILRSSLEGRKDALEIELSKAKEEQKKDPDSVSIQRLITRIQRDIADIERQLAAL
jgi:hypothetical protein